MVFVNQEIEVPEKRGIKGLGRILRDLERGSKDILGWPWQKAQ